jgi:hypothetical protein
MPTIFFSPAMQDGLLHDELEVHVLRHCTVRRTRRRVKKHGDARTWLLKTEHCLDACLVNLVTCVITNI